MEISINKEWVINHLPPRPRNAHKGSFGSLLIFAGSKYYRGAANLAVMGALRSGVGKACLASIEEVCSSVAINLPS